MIGRENKHQQFIESYEKYADAIFRHCYFRVFDRDKAQDFMQETFTRTWKYISNGNEVENIRAFLYRTATNIIIDESRKKKSLSLNEIMEKGFSPKVDVRESFQNNFDHKELIEVINSLDEKYKDALIMKYVDGFSTKEIAEVTGETESNVYVRIHRGLEKVKEVMQKYKNRGKI